MWIEVVNEERAERSGKEPRYRCIVVAQPSSQQDALGWACDTHGAAAPTARRQR